MGWLHAFVILIVVAVVVIIFLVIICNNRVLINCCKEMLNIMTRLILRIEYSVNHQSHSGPSEKWPRTSSAVANWNIICDSVGCSSNSLDGNGGSQRGLIWRPRKPRCSLSTTSQKTKRNISVRKKSSPKNCTYDESVTKYYNFKLLRIYHRSKF